MLLQALPLKLKLNKLTHIVTPWAPIEPKKYSNTNGKSFSQKVRRNSTQPLNTANGIAF